MSALMVDDGPLIPMFSNPEDMEAWRRRQEEKRQAAEARKRGPSLADLFKNPPASREPIEVRIVPHCDHDGYFYSGCATYAASTSPRAALRALHNSIRASGRVHIFASTSMEPGPRGPMADDCRGFVGLKWRLVA